MAQFHEIVVGRTWFRTCLLEIFEMSLESQLPSFPVHISSAFLTVTFALASTRRSEWWICSSYHDENTCKSPLTSTVKTSVVLINHNLIDIFWFTNKHSQEKNLCLWVAIELGIVTRCTWADCQMLALDNKVTPTPPFANYCAAWDEQLTMFGNVGQMICVPGALVAICQYPVWNPILQVFDETELRL